LFDRNTHTVVCSVVAVWFEFHSNIFRHFTLQ
jgi:hypothetical protein